MKIQLLFSILIVVLLLPLCMSQEQSLGYFKQNQCVNLLQSCSNCTYINITYIVYPNSSIYNLNKEMTKNGFVYNHTFCNTQALGKYYIHGVGDVDGSDTVFAYDMEITDDGKQNPDGIVIVIYSLLFFIIIGWLIYTLFMNIATLGSLNTDVYDVAFSMIGYIGMFVYYYFAQLYFAKDFVLEMTLWIIQIGAFTHIILPIISLVLAMTLGELKGKGGNPW